MGDTQSQAREKAAEWTIGRKGGLGMTLDVERLRAIREARRLLLDLIDPKATKRLDRPLRNRALWILRHYPWDLDLERIIDPDKLDHFSKIEWEKIKTDIMKG
jgi:hypothetical protein